MPVGTDKMKSNQDSVVILFKGGRLPAWHELTQQQRADYSAQHVELMLEVAHTHGMMTLEGFKLLEPQRSWERFWVMEFPTLEGAEAWIEAEMAPPYGIYGYYEYYLARRFAQEYFADWTSVPRVEPRPQIPVDPQDIPILDVDRSSCVLLEFARELPNAMLAPEPESRRERSRKLLKSVAQEHGLIRLEAFQLIAPQNDWLHAYVVEVPTLDAAEAWIHAEREPPHAAYSSKTVHLAYRWAPAFFARWLPTEDAG